MTSIVTFGPWQEPAERARAAGNVGDLLLLADEAPSAELRAETWIDAAEALRAAGQYDFALELIARALVVDAGNARALREQALGRQGAALPNRGGDRRQPRQVLVFSGHMVDAVDRSIARFPADKVAPATRSIAAALDRLGAGAEDVALTQGACGGDLLFTEACHQRRVPTMWLQPYAEADFVAASVIPGGGDWHRRYLESRAALAEPPRAAPAELGPPPAGRGENYPYERCNHWLLHTALAYGPDKLRLVCLWNGGGDAGLGGTAHMIAEVKRRTGRVEWIDTRTL